MSIVFNVNVSVYNRNVICIHYFFTHQAVNRILTYHALLYIYYGGILARHYSHRACFHATMLTNTVIKVFFGDLRAQQITAIIFQCGVLYHTQFDFLCVFIYVPEKWLQIPCIIN